MSLRLRRQPWKVYAARRGLDLETSSTPWVTPLKASRSYTVWCANMLSPLSLGVGMLDVRSVAWWCTIAASTQKQPVATDLILTWHFANAIAIMRRLKSSTAIEPFGGRTAINSVAATAVLGFVTGVPWELHSHVLRRNLGHCN